MISVHPYNGILHRVKINSKKHNIEQNKDAELYLYEYAYVWICMDKEMIDRLIDR